MNDFFVEGLNLCNIEGIAGCVRSPHPVANTIVLTHFKLYYPFPHVMGNMLLINENVAGIAIAFMSIYVGNPIPWMRTISIHFGGTHARRLRWTGVVVVALTTMYSRDSGACVLGICKLEADCYCINGVVVACTI
jgi:hypothetical protein